MTYPLIGSHMFPHFGWLKLHFDQLNLSGFTIIWICSRMEHPNCLTVIMISFRHSQHPVLLVIYVSHHIPVKWFWSYRSLTNMHVCVYIYLSLSLCIRVSVCIFPLMDAIPAIPHHLPIWRFPKIGLPPVISIYR